MMICIANIFKNKIKEKHKKLLKNNNISNTLNIYIDESKIENQINIIIYSFIIFASAHYYFKKADITNIYAIKLITIYFEINMTDKSHKQYKKCYIFVNSQSSI